MAGLETSGRQLGRRTHYEVRTSIDGSIYRVFFCIEGSTMVLLHALMKKTQKTPNSELEIARKRQKKVKS